MGRSAGGDAAPRPSYSRLLDEATAAVGAGRFAEAGELVDQLIRLDPARSEAWSLRGAVALNVFGDVAAARESYENALSRGGRVAFRVVHDHGSGQPPCVGTLFVTPAGIDFTPTAGGHQFQGSYPTIHEAAINDIYGAQYGMFHVKAQVNDGIRNFNFVVVRSTDQKLVNRRPDAEMLLGLVNRLKSPR
jgi:tetratricopeptide (TPR) repeat protein